MVALVHIVTLDGIHQADVSLVDEVGEGKSLVLVLLRHIHYEAQVRAHQLVLRLLVALRGLSCVVVLLITSEKRYSVYLFQI